MRPAYGYIRVSSDEQADSGLGLEAQRQRIRAHCEAKSLQLTRLFEDSVSDGKAAIVPPAGSQESRKLSL
jgi:DNA invertase Pin-like site-specific DNA recombinase